MQQWKWILPPSQAGCWPYAVKHSCSAPGGWLLETSFIGNKEVGFSSCSSFPIITISVFLAQFSSSHYLRESSMNMNNTIWAENLQKQEVEMQRLLQPGDLTTWPRKPEVQSCLHFHLRDNKELVGWEQTTKLLYPFFLFLTVSWWAKKFLVSICNSFFQTAKNKSICRVQEELGLH